MLFCSSEKKCAKVTAVNQTCTDADKCAFGSECYDGKCVAYGKVVNRKNISSTDDDLLCATFFADIVDGTAYCGYGPHSLFNNNYTRTGDDLNCTFYYRNPKTEDVEDKNYTAACGPNSDDYFYCTKLRGDDEFSNNLPKYKALWQETNYTCHVDSSIFYCKDIIDKGKQKLMAEFFFNYLITNEGVYPMLANNPDCVKEMINSYFYEIEDLEDSSYYRYSTLTLGLISILLLALLN